MTLNDIILLCENQRPSQFSPEELTTWINEVEFMVIDQILNHAAWKDSVILIKRKYLAGYYTLAEITAMKMAGTIDDDEYNFITGDSDVIEFTPYVYESDMDTTLRVPDTHSGVYTSYIFAKEDYAVGEFDRYNADTLMADAEYTAYASYYRRTHKPKG